jgi:hypothetical protein
MGSIISGGPAVIHHCVGVTGRHNKVHVGNWFILPLTDAEHAEIHAAPDRKIREKQLFNLVCWHYQLDGLQPLPFGDEVTLAIQDWHL